MNVKAAGLSANKKPLPVMVFVPTSTTLIAVTLGPNSNAQPSPLAIVAFVNVSVFDPVLTLADVPLMEAGAVADPEATLLDAAAP
jgi:hypothetical protein